MSWVCVCKSVWTEQTLKKIVPMHYDTVSEFASKLTQKWPQNDLKRPQNDFKLKGQCFDIVFAYYDISKRLIQK